jgi:hypothetical protein
MTGISRRAAARSVSSFALLLTAVAPLFAQTGIAPAPNRTPKDGGGPYDRLVIRGITVIDGTGAAPEGPMDVVVEHDRIVDVVSTFTMATRKRLPTRNTSTNYGSPAALPQSGAYLLVH